MQFGEFTSNRPLFHIGKTPVDVTRTIIVAHIVTALLAAMLIGMGRESVLEWFTYSSANVRAFLLWTFVTYPFVHMVSLWLAVDLVVLWWFGSEVESFLGTRGFAWFYGLLAVVPALALFLLHPFIGELNLAGEMGIHFAVFAGFALIHPNALLLFGIKAKWFAIVIIAVTTISDLTYHQWTHLWYFCIALATAFVFLHRRGAAGCRAIVGWTLDRAGRGPRQAASRLEQTRTRRRRPPQQAGQAQVDEILDKITSHGLHSLSDKERKILRDASRRGK